MERFPEPGPPRIVKRRIQKARMRKAPGVALCAPPTGWEKRKETCPA